MQLVPKVGQPFRFVRLFQQAGLFGQTGISVLPSDFPLPAAMLERQRIPIEIKTFGSG